MRLLRFALLPLLILISLAGLTGQHANAATTPGFTVSASNVSISDRGSGTSTVTIVSTDGYASTQLSVQCNLPNLNPTEVTLANCTPPGTLVSLPANGSVKVTLQLAPPAGVASNVHKNASPHASGPGLPVSACFLVLLGATAGVRRRRWNSMLMTLVLGAAGMAACLCSTGCIGRGGLAMSPGDWDYGVTVTAPDVRNPVFASFTVHVQD